MSTGPSTSTSRKTTAMIARHLTFAACALLLGHAAAAAEFDVVDIAPSAYQYRADRSAEENAPESWLALMRFAGQPLEKPADTNSPVVKRVLCAVLWEEIRPIRQVELTWPGDEKRRPAAESLEITTLDNQGTASSWWNNLKAQKKLVTPVSTDGGSKLVYDLSHNTCGLVISVDGDKLAADYAVPAVRVLVADRWKKMDIEIEWGYDAASAQKDYSGRIEAYDGIVGALAPIDDDPGTTVGDGASWHSSAKAGARRGGKASVLYMGTSKWRKAIPFTSQPEDAARTIVTVWSNSGNFSFLVADLENGPILAPEYGFFVRRTSTWPASAPAPAASIAPALASILLASKMDNVLGNADLRGWGQVASPWFAVNRGEAATVEGIAFPARGAAMHPGSDCDVAVAWKSPFDGEIGVRGKVTHIQPGGGDGVTWSIVHETFGKPSTLAEGVLDTGNSQTISKLTEIAVRKDGRILLTVGRRGGHQCDSTAVELVITQSSGKGHTWDLLRDVVDNVLAGNPLPDSHGNAGVWAFVTLPAASPVTASEPHAPPLDMASKATSASEFVTELQQRKLSTIRQRLRAHRERTWEEAVTAMRGSNLPPHPVPLVGLEPAMQVLVPCEQLTAQWNLGRWHLTRHCATNPENGRLWFNDHPYGILAAETYMILAALDMMGDHKAAEDGFHQWVSLPMQPVVKEEKQAPNRGNADDKHHGWALPDRPNGLFSEGCGCLTHAEGPPGVGGHMDGVHAFGPGSIGWALVEHYRMTGDKEWFKSHAPRIKANVEWMLRQRQTVQNMVPCGDRLWCKGLQPALQVTPDSGGLWMQFYEAEAYYWLAVRNFAEALATIDPAEGARLRTAAEAYRKDLLAAVERTIALSPVVPIRDGTYHSVIPFACYVRGLSTGAWGWQRDGSGGHVGPMYWETVQSAAALISPAGLLPPDDVRVQGYLDVLEDRLLLENMYVKEHAERDWATAGWQYQGGLERTSNMHLAGDDVPVFIRSFLNCYAVDILPDQGYIFNEHAVHGPPDKIYEEACFLERFRNLLVMENGDTLWIARATPRAWLEQGKKISVKNAPTHFGTVAYEIVSDVDHDRINAIVAMPTRNPPKSVVLRFRHPRSAPIKGVEVDGQDWRPFNPEKETIELKGLSGTVTVTAKY
ncbi:MAG: hypothetical protein ACYC6N_02200 [Pirellulaceae bacterium]